MGGVGHQPNGGDDGGNAGADRVHGGGRGDGEQVSHHKCHPDGVAVRTGHTQRRQLLRDDGGDQWQRDDHLRDSGAPSVGVALHEPCVERGPERRHVYSGSGPARHFRRQPRVRGVHRPRHRAGVQRRAPQPEAQRCKPIPTLQQFLTCIFSSASILIILCNQELCCTRRNVCTCTKSRRVANFTFFD